MAEGNLLESANIKMNTDILGSNQSENIEMKMCVLERTCDETLETIERNQGANVEIETCILKRTFEETPETLEKDEEDDSANCDNGDGLPEKKRSKREQKRMRRREAWLASRQEKRAKEREKLKCKRQEARLNNVDLGPSRQMLKNKTMAKSSCDIRVVVDMSFDDYMDDRALSKCLKQLLRCYTLNRRAEDPMQLYFTSFSGKCKQHMQKNSGYENWDVNFKENYITDVFPRDEIVYLSSESPNTVLSLSNEKVYVIGGLVDHNAHKGLCHRIAEEKGLSHAQLPIGNFLQMSTRQVLTIDHVFEILLYVSRGLTWSDAFLKVIPKRKGAVAREERSVDSEASTGTAIEGSVKDESVHSESLDTKIACQLDVETNNTSDVMPEDP